MIPVRLGVLLAIVATLLSVGCNPFRRTRKAKVPPVVIAAPPELEPAPIPEPTVVEAPEPPTIEQPKVSSIPPPPGESEPKLEPPPEPEPRTPAPPKRAAKPEMVGPVPVPQLAPLLTDEQRSQYSQEIDDYLKLVDEALRALSERSLSSEERESRDRIEALARQAREGIEADLATAHGLAERAALLVRELERSSR